MGWLINDVSAYPKISSKSQFLLVNRLCFTFSITYLKLPIVAGTSYGQRNGRLRIPNLKSNPSSGFHVGNRYTDFSTGWLDITGLSHE
jgi:hypothetical protein